MAIATNESGYLVSSGVHSTTTFSILFWAKPLDVTYYGIYYAIEGGDVPLVSTNGNATLWQLGTAHEEFNSTAAVTIGSWQEIAWIRNGVGDDKLYVDKVLSLSTAALNSGAGATNVNIFGLNPSFAFAPNGAIANLKVWDGVALTLPEIVLEGDTVQPQRRNGLWAWLPTLDVGRNVNFAGTTTFTETATLTNIVNPLSDFDPRTSSMLL